MSQAEKAQYRIVHPWAHADGFVKPSPKRPGSDVIEVSPDLVPSVTWTPLNEPAKRAHAKRMAEVEERKAAQTELDDFRDPVKLLRKYLEKGTPVERAVEEVSATKALRAKDAELAEMRAEVEALRAKQEAKAEPPAQGVLGADVKSGPKR